MSWVGVASTSAAASVAASVAALSRYLSGRFSGHFRLPPLWLAHLLPAPGLHRLPAAAWLPAAIQTKWVGFSCSLHSLDFESQVVELESGSATAATDHLAILARVRKFSVRKYAYIDWGYSLPVVSCADFVACNSVTAPITVITRP